MEFTPGIWLGCLNLAHSIALPFHILITMILGLICVASLSMDLFLQARNLVQIPFLLILCYTCCHLILFCTIVDRLTSAHSCSIHPMSPLLASLSTDLSLQAHNSFWIPFLLILCYTCHHLVLFCTIVDGPTSAYSCSICLMSPLLASSLTDLSLQAHGLFWISFVLILC